MVDKRQIERAMKVTLRNARDFLEDSKKLEEIGSIGHATSLAILGFEEAHKAYLISFFHPIFDTLVTKDYRDDLRENLRNHSMKQLYVKEFRTGLEYLLAESQLFSEEKEMLELPSLLEMKPSTAFAFSKKLDKIKNDGLYTDPFRSPIWYPSGIKPQTLHEAQNLLITQIKSVGSFVERFSLLDKVPERIIKSAQNEISEIISTITNLQSEGIPNLDFLEEKLSAYGESGKLIALIIKSYFGSEQMKRIQNEKTRIRQRQKKSQT